MQEPFFIQKIAVLGAGVMGAQIAAHCVNAGFETLLFDLAPNEGGHNSIVTKAIGHLNQLKPSPLATKATTALLKAKNYEDNLSDLSHCDLIIEAIAERLDWKEALYQRISPYLASHAVLVSNTSGLSVNTLSNVLDPQHRSRFCGVHFFNPPRYMHLAELIPTKETSKELLDHLETWLTSHLGKGVIRAKDTPNFIANRIGVFSLLATLHHAEAFNLSLDEVDALTGGLIGRPKSATFRTMDVVGLDTMQHVVMTMKDQLSEDPWHAAYELPHWLVNLIQQGHLGQKSGQGIYRKNGKEIEVYDRQQGVYRIAKGSISEELKTIMAVKDPLQRMKQLLDSKHPQAQFLVACFRDLFHYCAYHLADIADTTRDVDLAIRWGFGWQQGPFETWQQAGIAQLRSAIQGAIHDQQSMSQAALPDWVLDIEAFYTDKGAYSPVEEDYKGRSTLAVYKRQFFKEQVLMEPSLKPTVLFENDGVCLWAFEDHVGVLEFKTKANTIGQTVLDGCMQALDIAQMRCRGLIIYQRDSSNFSAGADLRGVAALIQSGQMNALEDMLVQFQQVSMRIKYSPIPVVAALRGRALGGGCEFILHCSAVVAAFESYPGLVELGVGLIPAGGGCKEMARRAATLAPEGHLMSLIRPYFEQIATAVVAGSAVDALERGYLQAKDTWVMHKDEVLFAALAEVNHLLASNYKPSLPTCFPVVGREGHAILKVGLVNWLEGGFISKHDYLLADQLASVLSGGDVDEGQLVDEAWMLKLERDAFMSLAANPLTQERIAYLLETGKPLRN